MDKITVVDNGSGHFTITEHRDSLNNKKMIGLSTTEAIQLHKDLGMALRKQKKRDIKNFGYYYSAESVFEQ